jgi:iron complex transport system substrate-binding protein
MRIVSLLPSATEIVCALGLRDELVGISHCCDYPPEIEGVEIVTRPAAPAKKQAAADASPAEGATSRLRSFIEDEIGAAELDAEALRAVRPDLVIVRDRAGNPGIGSRAVREALGQRAEEPADEPAIISLDAVGVEGIFHAIATIGAMAEAEDDAIDLLEVLREELGDIEQRVVVRRDEGIRPPRVVVLQAVEPPFTSGRWVPEQVRRAGGWDLLGREGEVPSRTTWESIRDVDPEMLLFAPVGMHLPAAKRAFARLELPEFWREIEAVRRGRIFIVEPVYFERPGPRIVDGVAMLAEIFDPDGFVETSPPSSWTPILE